MRLRVVLFGTGSPLSLAALAGAARVSDVVGVVTPAGSPPRSIRALARQLARRRAARPLRRLAGRLGARVLPADRGLAQDLSCLRPDLLCVASFPRLLGPELLEAARYGAVGLHPSLLPRHRGPDPLFWTYLQDDREAGVTLHWLDAGEDTGDILYQEPVAVSRGRPVTELYAELTRRGTSLLERALEAIPHGNAPRQPQDAALATREPAPDPRGCAIDWMDWSAERVFHVLSGIGGWYPLLLDGSGRPLQVERARLLPSPRGGRPPGTIERRGGGWLIHCRDGLVEVSQAPSVSAPLQSLRAAGWWGRRASG